MRMGAYILTGESKMLKLYFEKGKVILLLLLSAVMVWLCIRYSAACYRGIENGIGFCLSVLVPSLFLLMAVSSMIVRSGVAQRLCSWLTPLTKRVFGMSGACLSPLLLGMIGGYPVGARVTAAMHERGDLSDAEAEASAYMAVAAGPGFVVNYIGSALLNARGAGVILLIAETAATLATAVIVGQRMKPTSIDDRRTRSQRSHNLLVDAVSDASKATFSMCGMVVIFSAAIEVMGELIGSGDIADVLSAVMEITTGCNRLCGRYPIWIIAFFVGFGGLSVHFQIYAMLGEIRVKKPLFFLYRIISGIIAAILTYILVSIFPQSIAVFSTVGEPVQAGVSATIWGSVALVVASACFLMSITGGRYVRDSRVVQHR